MASAIPDAASMSPTIPNGTTNNTSEPILSPTLTLEEGNSSRSRIHRTPSASSVYNNPAGTQDEKKQEDEDGTDDDTIGDAPNSSSSVQVAVRVRPFLPQESGFDQCVEVLPPPPSAIVGGNNSGPWDPTDSSVGRLPSTKTIQIGGENGPKFTFDCALAGQTNQRTVYESSVAPLVRACLRGYNATVLAYGQTGSGKTFTILGPNSGAALQDEATLGTNCQAEEEDVSGVRSRSSDSAGVIPRALRELFNKLETSKVRAAKRVGIDPATWQDANDDMDDTPAQGGEGGASGADGAAGGQISAAPSSSSTSNEEKQALPFEYEVRVQFLELYGEEVRDLLCARGSEHQRLQIRDGGPGVEPEVVGASETKVSSAEEALLCLARGTLRRVTGATAMNAESSRSHAIMSVVVEQTKTTVHGNKPEVMDEDDGGADGGAPDPRIEVEVKCSKFHFVDLAGSERQKRSQAEGKRLKEGIDINKGLLVLGNVISALGDPKKRGKAFVPYRDSKLTRLLKGSLGGNHKTLMIVCVSPSSSNLEESLNCLRYANRAKNIQNNAVVNVDAASRLVAELRGQVQALAKELLRIHDEHGTEVVAAFSRDLLKNLSGGGDTSGISVSDAREGAKTDKQEINHAEEAGGGAETEKKDETTASGGYAVTAAAAAAAAAATDAAAAASKELSRAKEELLKKDTVLLEKDAELEKMKELLRQAREEIFTISEELYTTKAEREYYKLRTPDVTNADETMSLVSFEDGVIGDSAVVNNDTGEDTLGDNSVEKNDSITNTSTMEEDDRSIISAQLSVGTAGTHATSATAPPATSSFDDVPGSPSVPTPKSSSKRRFVRKYFSKKARSPWGKSGHFPSISSPRRPSSSQQQNEEYSSPVPGPVVEEAIVTESGIEIMNPEEKSADEETSEKERKEKVQEKKPKPPPKPIVPKDVFVSRIKAYEKEITELKNQVRDLQNEMEQKNLPLPSTPLHSLQMPNLTSDDNDLPAVTTTPRVIDSPLTTATADPIEGEYPAIGGAQPKDLPELEDDHLPAVIEKASEVIEIEKQHLSSLQQTAQKFYGTGDDNSVTATCGAQPLVAPRTPEHKSALEAEEMAEEKELHTITKKYLSDSDVEEDDDDDDDDDHEGEGKESKMREEQEERRPNSESAAAGTNESFQRRQEHMNAHLLELSKSIAAKEELIQALHASEDRYETMRGFYETKIQEMETMVNEREKERDSLLEELHKLEENSQHFNELKRKLKLKENHIAALRKKQTELKNLTNVSSRSATVLARLQQDIEQMKRQKIDLQRQISSEAKAHREQVLALRKEALQRNKEMLKLKRISDQKQAEAEKMQKLAKSRADEVGKLRAKYKESEKKLRMQTLKRGVMERAGIDPVMMGRRTTLRRKTAPANGVGASSLRQKKDKPKPLDDESAEKILSFFDAKVADVGRKEAAADKLAHEWEDHLDLIIRKEELSELLETCDKSKEDNLRDELDALNVQVQYKEGRIRTLSRRLGSKPPSRKSKRGGTLAQNALLEDREFKKLCTGATALSAAQAASKILFGMVVRERRRVASLARTASTLDQKALEAEVLAASKDAALRSQLEEQRHERASMAQTQQEQILSLMSLVQEEETEGSDGSGAAAGVGGTQVTPTKVLKATKSASSMLTILVNERTAVLEEQLTELRGEREAKEIYKAKVKESNAALDEKRQECLDLQRELKQVRSALRQIREYVKKTQTSRETSSKNKEATTDEGSSSDIVESDAKEDTNDDTKDDDNDDDMSLEMISTIIQDALHPPKKALRKRGGKSSSRPSKKPLLSPGIQRHVELMHSSDSEGDEETPEWAGDIMADLALIAEGEMPPALKKSLKRPPIPKRKVGGSSSQGGKEFSSPSYVSGGQNVFDRLTDPGRFTGVQKNAFSTKDKYHRHPTPSQGDSVRAGFEEMTISPEERKSSRPRGGRDKAHASDARSVSSHHRSFCDTDSLDGRTVDSLSRSASMPVSEYTKQNVFQRLHKNVTHSYAVGRKGKDETDERSFESPTPSVPSDIRLADGTGVGHSRVDTVNESPSAGKEWASEYAKQDVFERLQNTTTESTAVKHGKDIPPAPPHTN